MKRSFVRQRGRKLRPAKGTSRIILLRRMLRNTWWWISRQGGNGSESSEKRSSSNKKLNTSIKNDKNENRLNMIRQC